MPSSAPPRTQGSERVLRSARRAFTRRQWARRWLAWRGAAVALLLLALVVVLVWVFYVSSVLAVTTVEVHTGSAVPARTVRQAADVPLGSPLARVDLAEIAARVERLPAVQHADVSRSWPHAVAIDVVARRAVAVVARDGSYSAVDGHGVMFHVFAHRPAGLPVVHTAQGTGQDAIAEAAKVVAALPPDLLHRVAHVRVHTIDTITLKLRDGRTVLWGSADQSAQKAEVLAVLLRQKGTFYDVSVPGQPVLRR